MPNDLTSTRLRELIAAATRWPWIRHGSHFYAESDRLLLGTVDGPLLVENADLFLYLVNNASALADAQEAKELQEWLCADWRRFAKITKTWRGDCNFIVHIRAAKEKESA